ncbi:MAG: hypothetical protein EBZ44_06570 [Verrucomicrobia bacterium]|nr:hypothetical protein [Verrucomicrobiota bacterium]
MEIKDQHTVPRQQQPTGSQINGQGKKMKAGPKEGEANQGQHRGRHFPDPGDLVGFSLLGEPAVAARNNGRVGGGIIAIPGRGNFCQGNRP